MRSTSASHSAVLARDRAAYSALDVVAGEKRVQLLERRARIADQRQRRVLERVEFADVDVDEPHVRVLERGLRRGGEVAQRVPIADHQVGFARDAVGGGRAGDADRAEAADGRSGSEPLPACVSPTGMPVCSAKRRSASVASL